MPWPAGPVTFAAVIVPVMFPEVVAGQAGWPPPPHKNIITPTRDFSRLVTLGLSSALQMVDMARAGFALTRPDFSFQGTGWLPISDFLTEGGTGPREGKQRQNERQNL